MNPTELKMLRKSTRAFIKAKPTSVQLVRRPRIQTPAGAWTLGEKVTLDPQEFRLVPFKRRLTHQEVDNQDGPIPLLPYILIGYHTADVKRDDEFTYNGDHFKIVGVEPGTDDRTSCDRVTCEVELRRQG